MAEAYHLNNDRERIGIKKILLREENGYLLRFQILILMRRGNFLLLKMSTGAGIVLPVTRLQWIDLGKEQVMSPFGPVLLQPI